MKNERRNLLRALTLGGGAVAATRLPATWSKPVVDSVTLPAHAQTSLVSVSGGLLFNVNSVDATPLDLLVPRAMAQFSSVATATVCFDPGPDGEILVRALVDINDGCYHDIAYLTGTATQGVDTALILQKGPCFGTDLVAMVNVTLSGTSASGRFEFTNIFITASTEFVVSDPGCSISVIPSPCDREDDLCSD